MYTFLEFLALLDGFNVDAGRIKMIDDSFSQDYDEHEIRKLYKQDRFFHNGKMINKEAKKKIRDNIIPNNIIAGEPA